MYFGGIDFPFGYCSQNVAPESTATYNYFFEKQLGKVVNTTIREVAVNTKNSYQKILKHLKSCQKYTTVAVRTTMGEEEEEEC